MAALDPTRSTGMADVIREGLAAWRAHRAEAARWDNAATFDDVAELTAQFCEGKLQRTPTHYGPRDDETVEIAAPLAHANRQGFLTENSEPGRGAVEHGYVQHAGVFGLAHPETVERLHRLVRGTRLAIRVGKAKQWAEAEDGDPFDPTRHWDDPDLVMEVNLWDTRPGPSTLLWDRLGQQDWDRPSPLKPEETATPDELWMAQEARAPWRTRSGLSELPGGSEGATTPPEPPVGAWGPPTSGTPLVLVPPDAPPLPSQPEEAPLDLDYPGASGGRIDMPPAAQPYQPGTRTPSTPTPARPSAAPTTTGATMTASISDVRVGIARAVDCAQQTVGPLQQALNGMSDSRSVLMQATADTNQADAGEALARIAHSIEAIETSMDLVQVAISDIEAIGGRL